MSWPSHFETANSLACVHQVAVRFVRDTNATLAQLQSAGEASALDSYAQHQLPWRRSAVAFLGGVLRQCGGVHPSLRQALVGETMKLDRTIRSFMHDPWDAPLAPAGVPESHWWYRPRCVAYS